MASVRETYANYRSYMRRMTDVSKAKALLQWDQEVNLPPKDAVFRGQQIATLSGLVHEMFVADELGGLLHELSDSGEGELSPKERKNVLLTLRDHEKQKKYPNDFVIEMSKSVTDSFHDWLEARKANDFKILKKSLGHIIALKKEECEILGYEEHPYDALIDEYEPGMKASEVDKALKGIKEPLSELLNRIKGAEQVRNDFMFLSYDKEKQWEFGLGLLKEIGFDFMAGRQDRSAHPFTLMLSPMDVRLTTRVTEQDLYEMTWSTIHEGGHGLYDQGLSPEEYGLPSGEAVSLSIHESQSRLWENEVGRGLPFWKSNYPRLQKAFPENLGDISLEQFYRAINIVQPSLIRTNADEITYHFHIIIRFEMEKAIMENKLKVDDLKDVWNTLYKEYLGVEVTSDNTGILQDLHWPHGSFGYFHTYSTGSFYAAQFYHQAQQSIPDLEKQLESGNCKPLLEWLRDNIHRHGKLYNAQELCKNITGQALDFHYFMRYAEAKYSSIYKL